MKWEGTFAEAGAGGIRAVHRLMQERLSEIPHALHTDTPLGYLITQFPVVTDLFTTRSWKWDESTKFRRDGYDIRSRIIHATCAHRKEQSIDQSHNNIYAWIKEQGYSEYNPDHLTHFENIR